MNKDEVFGRVQAIFLESFEIEADRIRLDSHLFEDLDLDSIDAVDLAIKVQELTGKRIKPEDFKNVRTVQDVVDTIQNLMAG